MNLASWLVLGMVSAAVYAVARKPVRRIVPGRPELEELAPDIRARAGKLLDDLEREGFGFVVTDVSRSAEEQAALPAGATRTTRSRHVAAPGEARAFDVASTSSDRDTQAAFYLALRETAPTYGLVTGGTWSLDGSEFADYGLGWDAGHVQEAP